MKITIHGNQKTMPIYYVFNQNNGFIIHSQKITPLRDIIIPSGFVISKNQIYQVLRLLKKQIKKLLSKIPIQVNKKNNAIYYVFNQKMDFLYIPFKMKALNGIIMPKTCLMLKNAIYQEGFPFKMPFPVRRPDNIPDYPEEPDDDPGDDPDDS
ncbi:hypothetical protein [Picrophilus oshimae]|uniref:Uncharacterized protein n=1 Tax=Picrophilus torridus (strain ATCC 700027 / DSM 9790 / JCM 10055 / NBRC 100828 / KAW 2/3) TaxID=1122961 RepID=Q6L265_PICTO|nr:hypothetical protein [Picrophilus oshimae]AAT42937.1 hypothetical protein PTO0352 [Picrophilus oshimae DSM 9789]